jgi:hypothetical protein
MPAKLEANDERLVGKRSEADAALHIDQQRLEI